MKGWKTWLGAIMVGAAAALRFIPDPTCLVVSEVLLYVGGAFGIIGIGHKIEKNV